MSVRSGQSITTEFTTRAFATGAATDATGTPSGTLFVNGTADAASVTVTNQATGRYKAAVTLPTLAVGDVVSLLITATVSGVTDTAKVWEDSKDIVIDSAGLVDANTVKLGPSGSGTAQTARDIGASVAVGTGGIVSGSFAAGAIDAGAIATDAIGSNEISAAAVTKIQTGLATPTNITAGTLTTVTNLTNLPTIPTNWLTAAGLAADAVAEIQSGLATPTNITSASGVALTSGERTSIADAVLGRSVATVESTAAEWSLASMILAAFESSISGTTWTIKRTDGTTIHLTKTVVTNAAADPITGVS